MGTYLYFNNLLYVSSWKTNAKDYSGMLRLEYYKFDFGLQVMLNYLGIQFHMERL